MINKFQQGGKQDEAIMQFVQGIAQVLQADPQQVVQAAQQNPEALKAAVQVFQKTQDIKQAAQTFAQAVQQKTQAAKHGAKLNYIKSLKHQCAEDEEVYYFKKGGSVGCGCRKKEDGGEVTKAQKGTAVDKFKKRKVQTDFSKDEEEYFKGNHPANAGSAYSPSERDKKPQKPVTKVKNEDANAGDAYPPSARGKKPKIQAKSCGSKLKKHFNGGQFKPYPFYQKGKYLKPQTVSDSLKANQQNLKLKEALQKQTLDEFKKSAQNYNQQRIKQLEEENLKKQREQLFTNYVNSMLTKKIK